MGSVHHNPISTFQVRTGRRRAHRQSGHGTCINSHRFQPYCRHRLHHSRLHSPAGITQLQLHPLQPHPMAGIIINAIHQTILRIPPADTISSPTATCTLRHPSQPQLHHSSRSQRGHQEHTNHIISSTHLLQLQRPQRQSHHRLIPPWRTWSKPSRATTIKRTSRPPRSRRS